MKTHRVIALLAAFVGASFALPTHAAQKENAPEWSELFGGASLPVVWQSAAAASDRITAALGAKKLEGVAAWAETIHLASHALEDQVKLGDGERQKRLSGALRQAAKIADDVLDGATHNDAEETAAAHQRLQSALALAMSRLPKEITGAPPQTLRFARPAEPAPGGKAGQVPKK